MLRCSQATRRNRKSETSTPANQKQSRNPAERPQVPF